MLASGMQFFTGDREASVSFVSPPPPPPATLLTDTRPATLLTDTQTSHPVDTQTSTVNEKGGVQRTDHLADPVEDEVDDLLAHRVVTSGVVVGRVLLAADQLLRVEELTVGPRANLVCNTHTVSQTTVTHSQSDHSL